MVKVSLCHGSKGCPEVEVREESVRICNDEGKQSVVLRREEWEVLRRKIRSGEL